LEENKKDESANKPRQLPAYLLSAMNKLLALFWKELNNVIEPNGHLGQDLKASD
jgi:hypothetical protein